MRIVKHQRLQPEVIGARLKALRLALGYDRANSFCRFVDVSDRAWSHYENGRRLITVKDGIKLVIKTDVTLSWIYLGWEHTLPVHVAEKLRGL